MKRYRLKNLESYYMWDFEDIYFDSMEELNKHLESRGACPFEEFIPWFTRKYDRETSPPIKTEAEWYQQIINDLVVDVL